MVIYNELKKTFCLFLLIVCLASETGYSQLIYVKSDATGANNGSSWTDAFPNLQDAINSSSLNDTIYVAKGTYYPDRGTDIQLGDRNASFILKNGLIILGGFNGNEDFHSLGSRWKKHSRDWQINKTILSGDLLNNDNNNITSDEPLRSDNSIHIFTSVEPFDSITEINGFYIESGNANSTSEISGAMGGALFFSGTQLSIKNCLFRNNSALESGGAIYSNTGELKIKSAIFTNNFARIGGAVSFSGIDDLLNPVHPELLNCFFNLNSAADMGGAVYMFNGADASSLNNLFLENSTLKAGSSGAAVYADNKSYPLIVNGTFYKNNSAGTGGGVSLFAGRISNSIFRNNTAVSDAQIFIAGEPANSSALREFRTSSVEGGFTGDRIYDIDPLFLHPENPAGEDNNFGTFDDGLKLSPASPLIDSGDAAINYVQSDISGLPRVSDSEIDLGAYEHQRFDVNFEQMLNDLRTGGYSMLVYHTMTNPSEIDSPGHEIDLHFCWMQKNLSPEGIRQAQYLGQIFKVLQINFDLILCSPMCRTKEAARQMFGRDSTDHDIFKSTFVWLNPDTFTVDKRIRLATILGAGHNTIIVTHGDVITDITGLNEAELKEGDAIVIKPLGSQQFEQVAHFTTDSWERVYRMTLDPTSVSSGNAASPGEFALFDNYPNPFNPTTNLGFRIPHSGMVTLKVYDILGNELTTLVNEEKPAGEYNIKFNAAKLASGIYFYILHAGSFTQTKKLVLLK